MGCGYRKIDTFLHKIFMKLLQCTSGMGFLVAILTMLLWSISYFLFSPVVGVAGLFTLILIFPMWGFYRYSCNKNELFIHFASTTALLFILPFACVTAEKTEQTVGTGLVEAILAVVIAWWNAFLPLSLVDFASKKKVKRSTLMLTLAYLGIAGLDFYMYSAIFLGLEFVLGCLAFFFLYLVFYPILLLNKEC